MGIKERGSVALEYVIVSSFALVVAIATVAVVTQLSKRQIREMGERLGLDLEDALAQYSWFEE